MFGDFSFSSLLVFDVLVVCSVIVGALVFLYTIGKYTVVPMLCGMAFGAAFAALGTYVGVLPLLNTLPEYQQRVSVFIVLSIACYFIFRRHAYFEPSTIPSRTETAICAIVMAGFILAVVGSFLPADVLATLTPNVRLVFVADIPRTLWLLSPGVVFAAMRG